MDRHFTREEAQRIFAAAAERQRVERVREDGLSFDEIVEAAAAAGIDPEYVRQAAADFLRPDRAPLHRRFLGIPVELRQTITLPGTLDDETWFKFVAEIRKVLGVSGFPSDMGHVREWTSTRNERNMPIRVVAEPEGENTRVTIERKTWPRALGFSIAAAVNLIYSLIFASLWIAGVENELWIPALILFLIAFGLGGGASIGLRIAGKNEVRQFREVLDRIVRVTQLDRGKVHPEIGESVPQPVRLDLDSSEQLPDAENLDTTGRRRLRNIR